jgi:hypothetical protein
MPLEIALPTILALTLAFLLTLLLWLRSLFGPKIFLYPPFGPRDGRQGGVSI